MGKPIIKRYLSEDIFEDVKKDFKFLIDKINTSGFEYDFQIREDYFNIYYKGNSLAKVMCKDARESKYEVRINTKFFEDKNSRLGSDLRFKKNITKVADYICLKITSKLLHPLFQEKHLKEFTARIKEIKFQEEIVFEQMLITDNIGRQDLIIIDRQVLDKKDNTKIDLLALKHKEGNDYQFCIIEVKLGNNPELKGKVAKQLQTYIKRVEDNFKDYKECYEKNYKQKKELGLMFTDKKELGINIVPDVLGVIIVGGYSGIANKNIKILEKEYPEIEVNQIINKIKLSRK